MKEIAMSEDEKVGALRMQPSGRWAVCRPGQDPMEVTSGETFRVSVGGVLRPTRMEYLHHAESGGGGYYSVDGFELREGMRAAIGSGE
jgi:hypothetical protein